VRRRTTSGSGVRRDRPRYDNSGIRLQMQTAALSAVAHGSPGPGRQVRPFDRLKVVGYITLMLTEEIQ